MGHYRRLEAALFGLVADRTGLSDPELARRLGEALQRPSLVSATIRGWRAGLHAVPLPAFLAACEIASLGFGSPEVERLLDGFHPSDPAS